MEASRLAGTLLSVYEQEGLPVTLCSGSTARNRKVLHYRFGVPPECADLDRMHNWVTTNPAEWKFIFGYATGPQACAQRIVTNLSPPLTRPSTSQ